MATDTTKLQARVDAAKEILDDAKETYVRLNTILAKAQTLDALKAQVAEIEAELAKDEAARNGATPSNGGK